MRLSKRKRDQRVYTYNAGVLVTFNGMPITVGEESQPDAMVVEDAGTEAARGVYPREGDKAGKPRHTIVGGTTDQNSTYWNVETSRWIITSGGVTPRYESTDDVATPDLVTTWTLLSGDSPAPTVRRATWADITSAGIDPATVPIL